MSAAPVIGVVVFPGSNCDYDCAWAFGSVTGAEIRYIWHKDATPAPCDAIVLPGGFSYGDYLRCGAIARFSPVMEAIQSHARQGRPLIGICNGFQILCEADLLPGALYLNQSLNFICEHVYIRTDQLDSPFTGNCRAGQPLNIPIAHGEGQFYADDNTLDMLASEGRVAFRYCTRDGDVTEESNPNGSRRNIAGIFNESRTILGMMPHPERAIDARLGSEDGRVVLESLAAALAL